MRAITAKSSKARTHHEQHHRRKRHSLPTTPKPQTSKKVIAENIRLLIEQLDDHCPIHDPRAAARRAEHPEPVMPPAAPTETEEEAEARRQLHEQQRKEYQAEQERRAEERRLEEEQKEQEYEAEQARREEQRQTRKATFKRILANTPETLSAAQLCVLLRAIVNLDPYTFVNDLTEDIADGNERRSPEEVLLATIDATADEKLTHFAVRLALSGRVGIPRENEPDFLAEAEAFFTPAQKKAKAKRIGKAPVAMSKTKTKAKKQIVAYPQRESAYRLPRTFLRRRTDDDPVQLQIQDRGAGEGEVRAASPLQP